eukprot:GFUD01062155.1.p1 GENE.GFUD01062155.1~~GFUD01062155.1.p1  ORF type:complete len:103 (-),score=12.45 GFUD01062155.1:21-329(-)
MSKLVQVIHVVLKMDIISPSLYIWSGSPVFTSSTNLVSSLGYVPDSRIRESHQGPKVDLHGVGAVHQPTSKWHSSCFRIKLELFNTQEERSSMDYVVNSRNL